jgi:N-acetylmuramoyl-L-alanine amidase
MVAFLSQVVALTQNHYTLTFLELAMSSADFFCLHRTNFYVQWELGGAFFIMLKLKKSLLIGALLLFVFPYQAFAVKVVVDPGHGGKDPGAHGVNGLNEKDVTLDIAARLKDELVKRGYEVVMTRTDDTYVSLSDRVDFTNRQNADLFVSVHANWYKNPATKGTTVLYYDDNYPQADYPASDAMKALTPVSKQLAQSVQDAIVRTIHTEDLGLTPSAVYVVRMGQIPSILVETAFLSNPDDAALLADSAVRKRMAEAIERGIEAFKPAVFPDTAGHWARDAILRLKDKGIVEGIGNQFQPDRPLTRAEFLTLMDRVFSFSKWNVPSCTLSVTGIVYGGSCGTASFSDLNAKHWAYNTVSKAVALNLIQGYPDGTVRPDHSITRAEVAALFSRLIGMSQAAGGQNALPDQSAFVSNAAVPVQAAVTFSDVPVNYWAASAISELASAGIVNGVTDKQFMPERPMTRAEMAVLLDRYVNAKK